MAQTLSRTVNMKMKNNNSSPKYPKYFLKTLNFQKPKVFGKSYYHFKDMQSMRGTAFIAHKSNIKFRVFQKIGSKFNLLM